MKIEITDSKIKGNPKGLKLFTVTTVDSEDSEDTQTELWLADNEDQLQDLVKEEYTGIDPDDDKELDDEDSAMSDKFDEDWGIEILYNEVGTVINQ